MGPLYSDRAGWILERWCRVTGDDSPVQELRSRQGFYAKFLGKNTLAGAVLRQGRVGATETGEVFHEQAVESFLEWIENKGDPARRYSIGKSAARGVAIHHPG